MYEQFFGLQRCPFLLSCDPEMVVLTQQYRDTLSLLTYAILAAKEFVVLTGDVGTGKTTMMGRVLRYLPGGNFSATVVSNPTLTRDEFLETLMLEFGMPDTPPSKVRRLAALEQFLRVRLEKGVTTVLLVDEAHKLSPELLEEIRLLSNLEHQNRKLLPIVLVGQPELDEVLNRHDLRQLKQRIVIRLHLDPLPPSATETYIRHRWQKCGGDQHPFTAEALVEIGRASKGIPRLINTLCENAVLGAFAQNTRSVTAAHVQEACRDLHLEEGMKTRAPESLAVAVALKQSAGAENGNGWKMAVAAGDNPLPTLQRQQRVRPFLFFGWAGRQDRGIKING